VRRLRDSGISVIYVTHFIEEVKSVCDRYTVLRDGQSVADGIVSEVSIKGLVEKMVGRSVEDMYPMIEHTIGMPVLTANNLESAGHLTDVSFVLRRGEILGIAGLVGAGRSEMVRALFGLKSADCGSIVLRDDASINAADLTPRKALDLGLDLLSENRHDEGLAQSMTVAANLTMSRLDRYRRHGLLSLKNEKKSADCWCENMGVKCHNVTDPVSSLSGGNQQKIALARILHHDSEVILLDEPTRGIDVGSKAEIYRIIHRLASEGKAIVVVSSYLPELLGICDTIAVMHRGRLSEIRPARDWTEQTIMLHATSGITEDRPQ
ncbi:MAG: sugar ABC transporter ATP-binding protein, partial [Lentisphaerae bacterium]|nr:sugar ABC transporter ATP-binding protein [Lentisphaerota bacterium]